MARFVLPFFIKMKSLKESLNQALETFIGIVLVLVIGSSIYSHFHPEPPDPNLHQNYYGFDKNEKPSRENLLILYNDLTQDFGTPLTENIIEKYRYSGNIFLSRSYDDSRGEMLKKLENAIVKQGGWEKVETDKEQYYCREQTKLSWKNTTYMDGPFSKEIPAFYVYVSWGKDDDCRKWYYHKERYHGLP